MVTPDFEDWLRRQDFPIEETTTQEKWMGYLEDTLGIHGKSLDVAAAIYPERYDIFPTLGIGATERHYIAHGYERVETRYGITGYPGLWGYKRALEIALEKAEAQRWTFAEDWIRTKMRLGE